MTTAAQDQKRLLNTLLGDKDMFTLGHDYEIKIGQLNLTHEEVNFICESMADCANRLKDMIKSAVWDVDRNMLHTFIYMFDFCNVIMSHESTPEAKPHNTLKSVYERVTTAKWKQAGKDGQATEAEYRRVAVQVEAEYLKKALYLDAHEPAFTALDMINAVNVPLINNAPLIRKHLLTIMDYWLEMRKGRGAVLITSDVIGIASFLEEFPGAEDRVIAYARERHSYNEGALREYLSTASHALSEGVI